MGNPFIGEIRMFGGNFAPLGWAFCNGALVSISENEALFTLIGTTYGGDGQTTFALPDLRGRVPIHSGQGPGLSTRVIGERGGVETVTLTPAQMPTHRHSPLASNANATSTSPEGSTWANWGDSQFADVGTPVAMAGSAIDEQGGSQPHSNVPPVLMISFIISLFGIFPSVG